VGSHQFSTFVEASQKKEFFSIGLSKDTKKERKKGKRGKGGRKRREREKKEKKERKKGEKGEHPKKTLFTP
jgi:hypothetical protein